MKPNRNEKGTDEGWPKEHRKAIQEEEKAERIDAFAAAALTGLCAGHVATDAVAAVAYRIAENMEAERERRRAK